MYPLEGVGDLVDITLVQNPWQAIVVVVIVFALLIWQARSASQSAKRVERTLTTNNGGSTVKDANDRIERTLEQITETLNSHIKWSEEYVKEAAERVEALEDQASVARFRRLAE